MGDKCNTIKINDQIYFYKTNADTLKRRYTKVGGTALTTASPDYVVYSSDFNFAVTDNNGIYYLKQGATATYEKFSLASNPAA